MVWATGKEVAKVRVAVKVAAKEAVTDQEAEALEVDPGLAVAVVAVAVVVAATVQEVGLALVADLAAALAADLEITDRGPVADLDQDLVAGQEVVTAV